MQKILLSLTISIFVWNSYSAPMLPKHEEYFTKGEAEFNSGKYGEALQYFNAAISHSKDRYKYFFMRGLANKQMELTDEAIADLTHAIKLNPTTEALYERGVLHFNEGDMDAAKNDFEDVVASRNNYLDAQYYVGLIYYRAGVFDHAIEAFNRYEKLSGGDAETYYYRGLCHVELKHYNEAITDLNKALPFKNGNLLLHVKLCELSVYTNNPTDAITHITAIIKLSPNSKQSELYIERSLLYAQLGDIEKSNADRLKSKEVSMAMFQ